MYNIQKCHTSQLSFKPLTHSITLPLRMLRRRDRLSVLITIVVSIVCSFQHHKQGNASSQWQILPRTLQSHICSIKFPLHKSIHQFKFEYLRISAQATLKTPKHQCYPINARPPNFSFHPSHISLPPTFEKEISPVNLASMFPHGEKMIRNQQGCK